MLKVNERELFGCHKVSNGYGKALRVFPDLHKKNFYHLGHVCRESYRPEGVHEFIVALFPGQKLAVFCGRHCQFFLRRKVNSHRLERANRLFANGHGCGLSVRCLHRRQSREFQHLEYLLHFGDGRHGRSVYVDLFIGEQAVQELVAQLKPYALAVDEERREERFENFAAYEEGDSDALSVRVVSQVGNLDQISLLWISVHVQPDVVRDSHLDGQLSLVRLVHVGGQQLAVGGGAHVHAVLVHQVGRETARAHGVSYVFQRLVVVALVHALVSERHVPHVHRTVREQAVSQRLVWDHSMQQIVELLLKVLGPLADQGFVVPHLFHELQPTRVSKLNNNKT